MQQLWRKQMKRLVAVQASHAINHRAFFATADVFTCDEQLRRRRWHSALHIALTLAAGPYVLADRIGSKQDSHRRRRII
jgi:hypothetical protein